MSTVVKPVLAAQQLNVLFVNQVMSFQEICVYVHSIRELEEAALKGRATVKNIVARQELELLATPTTVLRL